MQISFEACIQSLPAKLPSRGNFWKGHLHFVCNCWNFILRAHPWKLPELDDCLLAKYHCTVVIASNVYVWYIFPPLIHSESDFVWVCHFRGVQSEPWFGGLYLVQMLCQSDGHSLFISCDTAVSQNGVGWLHLFLRHMLLCTQCHSVLNKEGAHVF